MLIILDHCQEPYFNLASEEFLLNVRHFDQPVVRIWQNSPAVIVGKFQNTLSEINQKFVKDNDIPVIRRITGGGAVYHDLGNVNYTIVQPTGGKVIDFARFAGPLIRFLAGYGLTANHQGRNDIEINERKISGGAQTISNGRVLHHGTLLFSARLDILAQALNPKPHKLAVRGVPSIRARVANIADFLSRPPSVADFMSDLAGYFLKQPASAAYAFSPDEQAAIKKLREEKYCRWEWNYGKSPDFNKEHSVRYPWGELSLFLLIENGILNNIRVYGDFFSCRDVNGLFSQLRGTPYNEAALRTKSEELALTSALPEMTGEELLRQLLGVSGS